MSRLPFWRQTCILAGDQSLLTSAAAPSQARSQPEPWGLYGAGIRWLIVALLAAVVLGNLLKPSPLRYLVVPLGLPFAFLSPATALATYILTVLVPGAFGEHNIAARLPVLLLVPLAWHALLYLNSRRPPPQRVLLLLQGVLCVVIVLLALATQTQEQIADSVPVCVGPIALLLAAVPLWTMSDRRFLFKVLAVAGAMVAIKTNLRFAARGPVVADSEDILRGAGQSLDPNYMSCYIEFGLICALYLLMEILGSRQKRWMVLVWLAPIAFSLVAVGQLASRGMTLALLVAFAVLVATASLKLPARVAVLGLVLLVGLGVAVSGGFDLLWSRFQKDDLTTGAGRKEINAIALGLFVERPFYQQLLGGGGYSSTRAMGWHTHNAFTEQLMDHGVVGASCFAGLFLCLGAACARTRGPIRASGLVLLSYTAVASLSVSPFMYAWGWVALASILPCRESGGAVGVGPPRLVHA